MRIGVLLILLAIGSVLPSSLWAQQWNARFILDSQVGYSTNSYLNDYLWEWDPSVTSTYWTIAPNAQLSRYFGQNVFRISAGYFFQPYFQSGYNNWKGGYGNLDFNRRWTRSLFTGIQMGGNHYTSSYQRSLGWIEPYIKWHMTDNMELQAKWNSTFRDYENLPVDTSSNRYDRVSLNYRFWPAYKVRIRAGLMGNVNEIGGNGKALSGFVGTDYYFHNGAEINITAGFEHYGFETTAKRSVNPRCDVYIGCSVNNTVYISNQDDLYRFKFSGTYPITARWAVNLSASYLKWRSESRTFAASTDDFLISTGVSYAISPDWGGRESVQTPQIKRRADQKTLFKIKFKGSGKLFLTGDFNNWERPGIPLIKGPNYSYRTTLSLEEGVYEYKVLKMEGGETEWLTLGDKTIMVSDGFGGMNGRMVIQ